MKKVILLALIFMADLLFAGPKFKGVGISQLIETRNGKTSCWGLVIQFDRLTLKKSIDQDELSIIEAKYLKDLKDIMTWSVDKTRKKLVIIFKQGYGDFGTGNSVTLTIKDWAFVTSPKVTIAFSIPTDPL